MENQRPKKVLCFGLVMADVLVNGLERLPQNWEEAVGGTRSLISVGGGASNSARTFGRLGIPVDLLGRVGGDFFGEFVRRECESDHVECGALLADQDCTTGVAVGLVHKNGKRCFVTAQGANRNITREDISRINLEAYDFLHINGYFQFPEIESDMRDILNEFHRRGARISMDVASSDPFDRWYEAVRPFVDCLDYFFLNDSQLLKLTGKSDVEEGARMLLGAGVGSVIVKTGPEGCQIYEGPGAPLHVPARRVPVVDTTGAGDSFDAAYVVGLRKGWSPLWCARFANTVAGINCGKLGATAGVPDYETAVREMELFYGAFPSVGARRS